MLSPPEHIQMVIEHELPCILGDKTALYQVFQNLLSNAIKYMDKAEGEVRIRCVCGDADWTLSIADNGPGIEEHNFENIFHLFHTGRSQKHPESTGIGLAIVKKIVEGSGGKIWLESVVGQGSEFFFTLPKRSGSQELS